jgi:putative phosphoribosyl transferase
MEKRILFKNRKEAGVMLAHELYSSKNNFDLVLAIPRGGLPLGAIIAKQLHLPLDVVLTKKIGSRYNKEYAIGALSLTGRILESESGFEETEYIESETKRIRKLLEERDRKYHKTASRHEVKDKKVILVDDGIATGNTMLATVDLIHRAGASQITLAIPVAPSSTIDKLSSSSHIDKVVCLYEPKPFYAIGEFYKDFSPVSDEEAITILEKAGFMSSIP